MIFLLFTVALASADPLRQALQSKDGLARLFTQYETVEGKVYSADEAKLRFRLFRKSVKNAADTNELDLGQCCTPPYFKKLGGVFPKYAAAAAYAGVESSELFQIFVPCTRFAIL